MPCLVGTCVSHAGEIIARRFLRIVWQSQLNVGFCWYNGVTEAGVWCLMVGLQVVTDGRMDFLSSTDDRCNLETHNLETHGFPDEPQV